MENNWDLFEKNISKEEEVIVVKEKYITVDIPIYDGKRNNVNWWVPTEFGSLKAIEILEKKNPEYNFLQFVTSPGNGGYREFAIMKLKEK